MPATDWFAEYKNDDDSLWHIPLICWALVITNEMPEGYVTGMESADSYTDFCEEVQNFVRYVHKTEIEREKGES